MGVKIANNISSAIRKAVDKGSLSLNVNGTEFAADKESLNISEPERLCETGQAYRDGYCGKLLQFIAALTFLFNNLAPVNANFIVRYRETSNPRYIPQ